MPPTRLKNFSGTFDPHPSAYRTFGIVYTFIGLPIFIFGLYCVWKKTPKETSKVFRFLYTLLISLSLITHILECSIQPLVIAPYAIAATTSGVASGLPISTNIEISVLVGIGTAAIGPIGMLFYYRINLLLPHGHILTRKPVKLFCHSLMCFIGYLIGFTLFLLGDQDQNIAKRQERGYVTDFLWNEQTIVYPVAMTFRCVLFLSAYGIGCTAVFVGTAVVSYSIGHLLKSKTLNMSKRTAELHWLLTKTLIAQMAVYGFIMATPVCVGTIILFLKVPRSDILTVCFAIRSVSSSAGVAAMVLVNKSYRMFLLTILLPYRKIQTTTIRSTLPNSFTSTGRTMIVRRSQSVR